MDGVPRSCYEFGDFRLEPAERLLTCCDRPVPLPPRTFDTLVALVERNGHLVEKTDLLDKVWNGDIVEEVNLSVHISALRKTLGKLDDGSRFIETVPKRGYRFAAPVRAFELDDDAVIARRFRVEAVEEEIETDDAKTPYRAWSWRFVIVATAMIATIGAAAFAVLSYTMSPRERDFAKYSWKPLSSDDKTGMAAISPNGEFMIYFQQVEDKLLIKMRRLGSEEAITIVPEVPVPCWGMTISHDNNFFYYVLSDRPSHMEGGTLYRVSVLGGKPQKILEGITVAPTLSPDDKRVGFMRNGPRGSSMLMTANAQDGSNEQVVSNSETQEALWNPQWSPDGSKFVCFVREKHEDGSYYSLVEVPAEGGGIKKITQPTRKYIWWHAWLHDGSGLIAIKTDEVTGLRQIVFVSYPDGAIRKISNDPNQYSGVSVSDDGTRMITNQGERQAGITVSDVATGKETTLQLQPYCPTGVTWTKENQIVFDGFAEGRRVLWTAAIDGSGQHKISISDAQDWSPSLAPDGTNIAFLSTRSGSKQIWKSGIDGRDAVRLSHIDFDVDSPRYSPDGTFIYFSILSDGKWKVARIPANGSGEPELFIDDNIGLWDVSPDGRMIAYTYCPPGAEKEIVVVADIESHQIVNRFNVSPKDILRWTRDGKELIYEVPDPKNSSHTLRSRLSLAGTNEQSVQVAFDLVDYALDQSPDGTSFAYIRGHEVSNLVMLSAN